MVVDADVGFDVAQIVISSIVPGTETDLIPTPVEVGSVYLDNLFFSNGNPVPEPAFVTPDAVDITFVADDLDGMDITAFGATATVTTSPNGDSARSRSSSMTGRARMTRVPRSGSPQVLANTVS